MIMGSRTEGPRWGRPGPSSAGFAGATLGGGSEGGRAPLRVKGGGPEAEPGQRPQGRTGEAEKVIGTPPLVNNGIDRRESSRYTAQVLSHADH